MRTQSRHRSSAQRERTRSHIQHYPACLIRCTLFQIIKSGTQLTHEAKMQATRRHDHATPHHITTHTKSTTHTHAHILKPNHSTSSGALTGAAAGLISAANAARYSDKDLYCPATYTSSVCMLSVVCVLCCVLWGRAHAEGTLRGGRESMVMSR